MAWTQTDIDRLKRAMASGVLTSKHGDTLLTFRSVAEMEKLLAQMEAEVNPSSAEPRRTVAGFSRGL
jgi:hypothetical protein